MSANHHRQIGTFRQLEILLAVAEIGSISGASESLALTQPTVSMQLKKLSDSVGLPLYEQIGRQLIFTDAGHAVLASAQAIGAELESLNTTLADIKGLKAGTLRLGVVTTAQYLMPHLLGEFSRMYPDVDVELMIANRQEIIERLNSGLDDFSVFSRPPSGANIETFRFLPNPLVAIAPLDHPLSNRGFISLAEFAMHPFLMREPGSGSRHAIEALFATHRIKPNVRMRINSGEAIKHAVMSGLGTSIVSTYTLAYGGQHGIEQLQVDHLPLNTYWHFAQPKRKRANIVADAFMNYVKTTGRDRLMSDLLKEFSGAVTDHFTTPVLT